MDRQRAAQSSSPACEHGEMSPPALSLSLPIAPLSPSLAAHVTALKTLSLSLALLPAAGHHSARIPFTSKASLPATVTDTQHVLVCLGAVGAGGDDAQGEQYWVKMSPHEAADYVERRRERLLLQQARAMDGVFNFVAEEQEENADQEQELRPFHPLFHNIPSAGPSQPEKLSTITGLERVITSATESPVPPIKQQPEQRPDPDPTVTGKAESSSIAVTPSSSQGASSSKTDGLIEIMTEGAAASAREKGGAEKDETVSVFPLGILKNGPEMLKQIHVDIQRRRFTVP